MSKINYQLELEKKINSIDVDNPPTLLLHSCCAPCSSYVLSYLSDYFKITVLYYNPNISPENEYKKRIDEQKRLISEMPFKNPVQFIGCEYDPSVFLNSVKGMEDLPEGSERCFICYRIRLEETARIGKENGFDYFTTTLSISPYKNAEKLNTIGEDVGNQYKIKHLPCDFKKKNGYKKSIEFSHIYNLYRQDYCGCAFSRRDSLLKRTKTEEDTKNTN